MSGELVDKKEGEVESDLPLNGDGSELLVVTSALSLTLHESQESVTCAATRPVSDYKDCGHGEVRFY